MQKGVNEGLREVRRQLSAGRGRSERETSVGERRSTARPGQGAPPGGVGAVPLLALQRSAGNAAVTALMTGKARASSDTAIGEIDDALKEIKKADPDMDAVERGLKATKAAGVPVDLEGEAEKPPPSALEVVKTGFGPSVVPPKKPVDAPGNTPPKSPLAKATKASLTPKDKGGPGAKVKNGGVGRPGRKGLGGAGGRGLAPDLGAAEADLALERGEAALAGDKRFEPPVKPVPVNPEDDPSFTAVTGKVGAYAKGKKAHPPAAAKAKEAQDAAAPPADDVDSQARAAKIDTMAAQQPGTFDKKAFIAAVKSAIEAKSPKTLKEADEYQKSGKAGQVKDEVKGLVSKDKDESKKDIEGATDAPPDPSKADTKHVTPMGEEDPGQPGTVDHTAAVPKPAAPKQTNLEWGKHEVDKEMAGGDITEGQLEQSNEGEFHEALGAKKEAAAHADGAPKEFREHEEATLEQTRQDTEATTAEGMAGMHDSKAAALTKVLGGKVAAKSKDEQKRAEVTAKVQSIYAATEADVKEILDGLDAKVDGAFEAGEQAARAKFEQFVAAKMSAYKKDRYGGVLGKLRWGKDKLLGMPSKVNEFFEAGRELYLKEMDRVISNVADIVGNDLNAAKARIAQGRQEIADYVQSLPTDLQKVGQEAADDIGEQFAQLESEVDAKQESLVDSLAAKYVEARKGLDERIEQLQEENKGLVSKAVGAIKKVVATIKKLKDMLLGVLANAAGVIGKIIKNPIGFLKNLVAGIKGGILKFKDNIVAHLQKGLMAWLFGALGEAGIQLPDKLDLKGIVKLVTSVLGLTWNFVRTRLVKKVGEKAAKVLETGVDIFAKLAKEGPAGIWQDIVAKVGDIKEMILSKVREFVITKIIIAGVTWLISLLNPAAAFIKACKLIYDIVMFFVRNASRLADLVRTIIDSVAAIAAGHVGAVVGKIEQVLGKILPIVISFLASILGLGGIGKTIRSIIDTISKPMKQAIDAAIKKGLAMGRKLLAKAKALGGKGKDKIKADPAAVKATVKRELLRKRLAGNDQARRLLASVYQKYRPQGLKSLELQPDPGDRSSATVLVRASAAEAVKMTSEPAKLAAIAVKFDTMSKTTSMMVSYEGKHFKTYTNRKPLHAEGHFQKDVSKLVERIRRERAKGVLMTPPGTPVPVTLDMNRLPCEHCADRLISVLQANSQEISLRVNAASDYKKSWDSQVDLLSDAKLRMMIKEGIEIRPLHIWPIIERQARSQGVKELVWGRRIIDLNLSAGTFASHAHDVQDRLDKVNRQNKKDELKQTKVGV